MRDIELSTFAEWIRSGNILGVWDSPLKLRLEVMNNGSAAFVVRGICISVKNDYLLWKSSKDILPQITNDRIDPQGKYIYKVDVRHILRSYSANKQFTMKVFGDDVVFESDILSVNLLNLQQLKY